MDLRLQQQWKTRGVEKSNITQKVTAAALKKKYGNAL
jgi:hypothetical protein